MSAEAIKHLLLHCGSLKPSEKLCILCDPNTRDIAHAFREEALKITEHVHLQETPLASRHGEEPPEEAIPSMLDADLIISLCTFSLAHSNARIQAGLKGARFLSMPLYDWDLLKDEAVLYPFQDQAPIVRKITDILTHGSTAYITTKAGTDISLDLRGRTGNYCPGFVSAPGELGSPPDIESNISPIESGSNGVVVIDGSITCPEIGLLTSPVTLKIENGFITEFQGQDQKYIEILNTMFDARDSKKRILAECGIGLNPAAKLTGKMLTDEGTLGTIHFGFGSNYTVGGQNKVNFHLDFVFKDASLKVDDIWIMQNGKLAV